MCHILEPELSGHPPSPSQPAQDVQVIIPILQVKALEPEEFQRSIHPAGAKTEDTFTAGLPGRGTLKETQLRKRAR